MRLWVVAAVCGLLLACAGPVPVPGPPPAAPDSSDLFFAAGVVRDLKLEMTANDIARLRSEPRVYVPAALSENGGEPIGAVAVKLKGAAGSFRGVDNLPALTLNVDKFVPGRRWHGLDKFHLNNSVQDASYACEFIATRLFTDAGIPVARTSHARVWLNDRELGLYVLKEGFDAAFLKRHFQNPGGNLYDGGFVQDITARLERDEGSGTEDRQDLQGLLAACREREMETRAKQLEARLDVDRFLSLMAIELMMAHWDGYTWNKNNYRIYVEPATGRAVFLPHGMDQLFQDPGFGVVAYPNTIVSSAVMQVPALRTRYRERLVELLPRFDPARLHPLVNLVEERLKPVLEAISPDRARGHAQICQDLRNRTTARFENLKRQVAQADPKPLEFDKDGIVRLADWRAEGAGGDATLKSVEEAGRKAYLIHATSGNAIAASWRRRVLLRRGRYVLEVTARTEDVAVNADERGTGAGLRLSGAGRGAGLVETTDWTPLTHRFAVFEEWREVDLVVELRATAGRAWFDRDTLLLRLAK